MTLTFLFLLSYCTFWLLKINRLRLLFDLGPGCSSIAYGEAEEIGPFHINADGKSLYLNPYSWNQGMIYLAEFSMDYLMLF